MPRLRLYVDVFVLVMTASRLALDLLLGALSGILILYFVGDKPWRNRVLIPVIILCVIVIVFV